MEKRGPCKQYAETRNCGQMRHHTVSPLLEAALQAFVDGAGGWETRETCRCLAYERTVSGRHAVPLTFGTLFGAVESRAGVGSFSELVIARRTPRDALQLMRSERQARWKVLLPKQWDDRLSVLYRWLEDNLPAWGSVPILTAAGTQCTTVQEVDDAVKGYWGGPCVADAC